MMFTFSYLLLNHFFIDVYMSTFSFYYPMAIKIVVMQACNILNYCMAKIYCHINQCNASVQYFEILHANKYCMLAEKPVKLKIF